MPTDSSSQTSTSSSISKVKQGQLESGRRKLQEFRKRKAEEKKNKEKNRPSENLIDGEGILTNDARLSAADEGNAAEEIISTPSDRRESLKLLASDNGYPRNKERTRLLYEDEQTGRTASEETPDTYVHGAPRIVDSINSVVKSLNDGSQNTSESNGNTLMYERLKPPSWARGVHNADSSYSVNERIKGGHVQDDPNGYSSDGSARVNFQGSTLSSRQNGIPYLKEEKIDKFPLQTDRQDRLFHPVQSMQKANGLKSGSYENLPSFMMQQNNSSSFSRRSPFQPSIIDHQIPMANSREDVDLSTSGLNLDREIGSNTDKYVGKLEESHASSQEEFSALEQHIDELTQEKFSLQRALDAARSLSESLSQQNSFLTEDFNSQATVINQLQEELEKKNEELASQSLVLSRLMKERERAQQENNSAIERSQILAGEVILLEEKLLKLRSSELKLQRELESLKSVKDSYRAQTSTLEKDRQHIQSMLENLLEDKKILQGRLETIVADGPKSVTIAKIETKEASTSTYDLDTEVSSSSNVGISQYTGDIYNLSSSVALPMLHESGFPESSPFMTFSLDDDRVINHIDMLITDLVAEKSNLLQMLTIESSKVAELQSLNSELSKKLEVQTQRLELAVAQNMAGRNADVTHLLEDRADIDFVDEGDEVVERVLGWIMQLFPGGSSKRRTSRLL